MKKVLGVEISSHILFIHAVGGCDSTFRLFGIGKGTILMKLLKDASFLEQAKVFSPESADKDKIIKAGENALDCLYKGKLGDTLNSLRHKRFIEEKKHAREFLCCCTNTSSNIISHTVSFFESIFSRTNLAWKLQYLNTRRLWLDMQKQQSATPHDEFSTSIRSPHFHKKKCRCKGMCVSKKCSCRKHNMNSTPVC
ncbi:hypothetical protein PR048_011975 [Dryococelus australis]|uniref:Uncharacterized protein n=1 Tax=Dryococelus australis TaxID=614101 RepID=A0ABQ9HNL7_9NEOP|nr:hypothetical protein PR048_011975 [Dryococelus australis]